MNSIQLTNISKSYHDGKVATPVLHDLDLTIKKGEMVAIMGPSGSGKSTLMNIIGLLDRPTEGTLELDEEKISLTFSDSRLAKLRSQKIGFVFQSFNLLPRASALTNVLMPTTYNPTQRRGAKARALALLASVGLKHRIHHKPSELSGGEKQRVAIARALINQPDIILADEPTGNLDSKSGGEIMTLLRDLNKEGKTIVIISHDPAIARQCQRVVHIHDGHIRKQI